MISWFRLRRMITRLSLIGLVLVASVWVFLMIFGLPPFPTLFPGLQKYANQSAGFAVSYPNTWLLLETPNGSGGDPSIVVTISYPKVTSPGIYVSISRSTTTYTSLLQVADWGRQMSSKSQNYQEISTANMNINGEDTMLQEYTIQLPKSPLIGDSILQCLGNYRLHNNHGYVLTLCASRNDFSQTRPIFEKIIDSFFYLN